MERTKADRMRFKEIDKGYIISTMHFPVTWNIRQVAATPPFAPTTQL